MSASATQGGHHVGHWPTFLVYLYIGTLVRYWRGYLMWSAQHSVMSSQLFAVFTNRWHCTCLFAGHPSWSYSHRVSWLTWFPQGLFHYCFLLTFSSSWGTETRRSDIIMKKKKFINIFQVSQKAAPPKGEFFNNIVFQDCYENFVTHTILPVDNPAVSL